MIVKRSQQTGFTLLETMVAIAILLIAVVGPLSLMGGSLQKIYFARDQMVAINLAQEAIEAVRQVRDTNMLGGVVQWDNGFGTSYCTSNGYQCLVDVNPLTIIKCNGACGGGDNTRVYQAVDGSYHQYFSGPSGTPTVFKRILETSKITNDEYKVTSTVTWQTGGSNGSTVVSENIFKWAL